MQNSLTSLEVLNYYLSLAMVNNNNTNLIAPILDTAWNFGRHRLIQFDVTDSNLFYIMIYIL